MRLSVVVAVCLLGLPTGSSFAADEGATVPVGVASVDITPSFPIRLAGYGARKTESEGVEQRLHAKALAIGADGQGPLVLVTVDNCGVPGKVTDEVAARLRAKAGLQRERFVVCSSHTHCGPCLDPVLPYIFGTEIPEDQKERVVSYTKELANQIEKVALAALTDRKPGRLAWGEGSASFAANRRVLKDGKWVAFGVTPGAPVDHAMPILRATDSDGKLRAVLVNYACHCTTLGGEFNKVCGDWAGYAQEAIEKSHPGAVALVAIGCGADANPEPRGKLDQAKAHGEAVAREVDRLLGGTLRPMPTKVEARLQRIELPFAPLPTREEWESRAKQAGAVGLQAKAVLTQLDRGVKLPTTLPYVIQSWSFGDALAMVFLAGEVVVDYDLRLKKELDGRRLWISAYSNDVPCYIASKRILQEGGYEADQSMVFYGRPTRLAQEVEDRIVEAVNAIVPEDFSQRRK